MKNKGFIGPVAMIMLFFAMMMDAFSFFLALTGLCIFSFINGFLAIFLYQLMRIYTGSEMQKKDDKKMQEMLQKKLTKKVLKKLGLSFLIEIIPLIGGMIPLWSISVLSHFMKAGKEDV